MLPGPSRQPPQPILLSSRFHSDGGNLGAWPKRASVAKLPERLLYGYMYSVLQILGEASYRIDSTED